MKGIAIGFIILVLSIVFLVVLVVISIESRNMCENQCADRGTRFSKIVPNGELFNTRDLCVCYHTDKIESFVMGGDE